MEGLAATPPRKPLMQVGPPMVEPPPGSGYAVPNASVTPPPIAIGSPGMGPREVKGQGFCVVPPLSQLGRQQFTAGSPTMPLGGYSTGLVAMSPRGAGMEALSARGHLVGQPPSFPQRALSPQPPGTNARSMQCLHTTRSATSSAAQLPVGDAGYTAVRRLISSQTAGGSATQLPAADLGRTTNPIRRLARSPVRTTQDEDIQRAMEAPGSASCRTAIRTISPVRNISPPSRAISAVIPTIASPRALVACAVSRMQSPGPVRMQSAAPLTSTRNHVSVVAPVSASSASGTMDSPRTILSNPDQSAEVAALRLALAEEEGRSANLRSELAMALEDAERHRNEAACLAGELRRLAERATLQLECKAAGDAAAGDPVTGTLAEIAAAVQPIRPLSEMEGGLSPVPRASDPATPVLNLAEIPEEMSPSVSSSRGTSPPVSARSIGTTPVTTVSSNPSAAVTPLPSQPERKPRERKPKDEIDRMLMEFIKETQCPMKFNRVNKGFYDTAGHHIELSIISGKLMVKLEGTSVDLQWNRGKFGPIERFVAAYDTRDI